MKIDQNWLIYGGIAVVAIVVYLFASRPEVMEDIKFGIGKIFGGGGNLTQGEEVDQSAMYSHYY